MKLSFVLAVLAFTSSAFGVAIPEVEATATNKGETTPKAETIDHLLRYWRKSEPPTAVAEREAAPQKTGIDHLLRYWRKSDAPTAVEEREAAPQKTGIDHLLRYW
ncbi:hypothetical protein GLAREA_09324 [Glarea lozoyensis ATCC 20868]|uniref:RxLR effector protein n=1 Tax=Glarea lozoyensis (strain ATCC 20868 / MF5171) TaxID=1116229 RepID=S3DYZ9_GLAL2|nr:uncharacterized protein GLAREA_09324 [Glarea lozoyensis ATCC 20868]EPE37161.1 hypothetical protein GLAREA_09324 [Glarea lozoyensis ATCC 20868]